MEYCIGDDVLKPLITVTTQLRKTSTAEGRRRAPPSHSLTGLTLESLAPIPDLQPVSVFTARGTGERKRRSRPGTNATACVLAPLLEYCPFGQLARLYLSSAQGIQEQNKQLPPSHASSPAGTYLDLIHTFRLYIKAHLHLQLLLHL